ncbi:hypothetical protein BT67DRAFT_442981 [Trichocladium antarcticum]|uniref:Uncharacterized protein n=1 Tax=Trichocladium antarcticum TaxID=1450529 RepID=A0AAN6UJ28_9PEZI|nr:hypothetical protein BT67DRAFT_442981 [Trichocladium antarcticum]
MHFSSLSSSARENGVRNDLPAPQTPQKQVELTGPITSMSAGERPNTDAKSG